MSKFREDCCYFKGFIENSNETEAICNEAKGESEKITGCDSECWRYDNWEPESRKKEIKMSKFREDCCSFQGIVPYGGGIAAICNEANGESERITKCHPDCFRYNCDMKMKRKEFFGTAKEDARDARLALGNPTEEDKKHYNKMRALDERWIEMRNAIFNMEQRIKQLEEKLK